MDIQEIINKYELKVGSHPSLEQGACVMEMVSYIANEPWSDRPACACPTLTSMAIRYNDRVDDEHRQKLKELIPLLVNSKNPVLRTKRANLLALRSVTVFLPLLTDALELPEISEALRAFTADDFLAARDFIRESIPKIREAAKKYPDAAAAAYADADAYAATDADADAYAAAAAYADAAAYAAADAYAAAATDADADARGKKFWVDMRLKLWAAWFDALKAACELKE